jgi:hypothetical protein
MVGKLSLGFLVICGLGFAQIDGARFASDLRAKYGPPLARETFTGKPGIEMVVDYAANGHVCRIQLPPMGPGREPGVSSAQAIDEFIAELVPMAMRGKELQRISTSTGAPSMSTVQYENVTISEALQAGIRTGMTIAFTKEQCRSF